MFLFDRLTLDAPRRTADGYLAVRARSARTGVYKYTGREVDPENQHGLRDMAVVNVLRDDATVFDQRAARSFVGKPITDDHPREAVTADNWRDHARGVVMGALRDGEYLAFDLMLTDAAAISKVESGKRELSNGYGAKLEFGEFRAADGTVCQARQVEITGNHVALVDAGRAGPECAIALCDANPAALTGGKRMKTLTIDGLMVTNVSDEAEAAINRLLADNATLTAKANDAQSQVAALTTEAAVKDGKIAELQTALDGAKVTPAMIADTAREYADVTAKAKAMGVSFGDGDTVDAIKKAVVSSKLGDKAAGWSDKDIAVSFDTLTASVDPLRDAIKDNAPPTTVKDSAAARKQWMADKATAYRQ